MRTMPKLMAAVMKMGSRRLKPLHISATRKMDMNGARQTPAITPAMATKAKPETGMWAPKSICMACA